MEKKIFVGYGYGRFKNEKGEMQDYCNVFMLEDFFGEEKPDYYFAGKKAVKYKCVSPVVFQGINVGATVECYFNSKNQIAHLVEVDAE